MCVLCIEKTNRSIDEKNNTVKLTSKNLQFHEIRFSYMIMICSVVFDELFIARRVRMCVFAALKIFEEYVKTAA